MKNKANIKKYNKEIDEAVKRVRKGKSISNDQVMKQMETW